MGNSEGIPAPAIPEKLDEVLRLRIYPLSPHPPRLHTLVHAQTQHAYPPAVAAAVGHRGDAEEAASHRGDAAEGAQPANGVLELTLIVKSGKKGPEVRLKMRCGAATAMTAASPENSIFHRALRCAVAASSACSSSASRVLRMVCCVGRLCDFS